MCNLWGSRRWTKQGIRRVEWPTNNVDLYVSPSLFSSFSSTFVSFSLSLKSWIKVNSWTGNLNPKPLTTCCFCICTTWTMLLLVVESETWFHRWPHDGHSCSLSVVSPRQIRRHNSQSPRINRPIFDLLRWTPAEYKFASCGLFEFSVNTWRIVEMREIWKMRRSGDNFVSEMEFSSIYIFFLPNFLHFFFFWNFGQYPNYILGRIAKYTDVFRFINFVNVRFDGYVR